MSRSRETYGKKDVRSKQEKKRKEKEQKRLERKENKRSGNPGDEFAYVDEFGNLTSSPPDTSNRTTINAEDIEIGVPKRTEPDQAELVRTGVVTFFDANKGYGFIKESISNLDIFFHINGLLGPVQEGAAVTFETVKGLKGPNAINVKVKGE